MRDPSSPGPPNDAEVDITEDHIRWANANDTNIIPRVLIPEHGLTATACSTSFFREHPAHELGNPIFNLIQHHGLVTLMNKVLVDRKGSRALPSPPRTAKRLYHTVDSDDAVRQFMEDGVYDYSRIASCSFLKPGVCYSVMNERKLKINMKLTTVIDNAKVDGYFELAGVSVPFTGETVDFSNNDLRCSETGKFNIEASIFSNLLRNRLCFDFELRRYIGRHEMSGKPFYMDKYGYLQRSDIDGDSEINSLSYPAPTKFPNSSVLHRLENMCGNRGSIYKLMAKWFDLPPLNEFINTPSPPTPPNGKRKCVNNPEHLLICTDCTDLMLKNFIFLKLEINLEDLLKEPSHPSKNLYIRPDMVYKRLRRLRSSFDSSVSTGTHSLRDPVDTAIDFLGHQRTNIQHSEDRFQRYRNSAGYRRVHGDAYLGVDGVVTDDGNDQEDDTDDASGMSMEDDYPYDINYGSASSDEAEEEDADADEDGDIDELYEVRLSSGRSRRIESLLFERNLLRGELHHRQGYVPAHKLYKNSGADLKLKMLVAINRITGDLYMIPGNLDKNNWSSEENNGELFTNYQTFDLLYQIFFDTLEADVPAVQQNFNAYINHHRKEEKMHVQKLMLLLLLTNPALLVSKKSLKTVKRTESPQPTKRRKTNIPRMFRQQTRSKKRTDNEFQNSLVNYFNDNVNFGFDPKKVVRMRPNENMVAAKSRRGGPNALGSFYSFSFV